jgi:Tfp pilus assembly protein PilO
MEEKLKQLTFGKAIIGGLVLAAIYYFAIYNNGAAIEESINTTQTQITAQEQELTTIKKAIADAERYQMAKKTLGQELDVVLKAIPVELSAIDLMRTLSNEAKSIGVSILSINAQQNSGYSSAPTTGPKPFFEPVGVTVNLEGSYNQLMLFLSNLTKTDRIITVGSMNLQIRDSTGSLDGKGATVLKMNGEFKAYRYLPSEKKEAKPGG